MTSSRDTRAARALLAHFNHELAGRLVNRLLRVEDKKAWQALSDAVLVLIPLAAKEKVWSQILDYAEKFGTQYVTTESFKKLADKCLSRCVEGWIEQAVNQVVKERAHMYVTGSIKNYENVQFLKTIPGKFQAYVDEAIRLHAKDLAIKSIPKN
jgi:uncharacterized protein YehS (DUF1456 family)